jgi:hypothetical protein
MAYDLLTLDCSLANGKAPLRVIQVLRRAVGQVFCLSPPRRSQFDTRSSRIGFMADKVTTGKVSSVSFCFLCKFSFHLLLHTPRHLPSRSGTIRQTIADVTIDHIINPQKIKSKISLAMNVNVILAIRVPGC